MRKYSWIRSVLSNIILNGKVYFQQCDLSFWVGLRETFYYMINLKIGQGKFCLFITSQGKVMEKSGIISQVVCTNTVKDFENYFQKFFLFKLHELFVFLRSKCDHVIEWSDMKLKLFFCINLKAFKKHFEHETCPFGKLFHEGNFDICFYHGVLGTSCRPFYIF